MNIPCYHSYRTKKEENSMISHEGTTYREHMRDGRGTVTIHDVLSKEDLNGHGRLYARIVIPAGASIGWHIHEGETEPFYILKGEGTFIDNDHVALYLQQLFRYGRCKLRLCIGNVLPGVYYGGSSCYHQPEGR